MQTPATEPAWSDKHHHRISPGEGTTLDDEVGAADTADVAL